MRPVILLLVASLAGCVAMHTPAPPAAPPPPPPVQAPAAEPPPVVEVPTPVMIESEESRQLTDLLGYYQRVALMGAEDQRRELTAMTQSFNRERSSYNRMRLALLHVVPGTAFQDDARAAQLLEPLTTASGGNLQKLASLVYGQVTERVKTQKRADQLKDQLEALRAIERSLIERDQQPTLKKP